MIDSTHDVMARSWVESANGHTDFPLQNLPFGVAKGHGIVCAIGDKALCLKDAVAHLDLSETLKAALLTVDLTAFLALHARSRQTLRPALFAALKDVKYAPILTPHLREQTALKMDLPVRVRDYSDFYAGIFHAKKVGSLFRPDQPLMPNYKHIPIGYHGRASTVRPSGEDVRWPSGQLKPPQADAPYFGPSKRLDYELELGIFAAGDPHHGQPIKIDQAHNHIGGYCLLNDWSARDIQAWEYQPLGPFLAKSFHTTLSPWLITPEALAPFQAPLRTREADDPAPLDYLWDENDQKSGSLALTLEVFLKPFGDTEFHRLSQTKADLALYWSPAQMITHHASNGCDVGAGDLLGSGTLSGSEPDQAGSLLELSDGGKTPIRVSGHDRTFLQAGDTVRFLAYGQREGFARIGFGACEATVTG